MFFLGMKPGYWKCSNKAATLALVSLQQWL